jgi:AcrR family transcriptional regulator
MRPNIGTVRQRKPTFIEEARRRQIVDTAIQTIATRGFSQTSLAEIARDAGISKGVISYHFSGKEELIEEILRSLLREPAEFVKERVNRAEGALEKLGAYVGANFEYMASHREEYVALVELWGLRGDHLDHGKLDAEAYEPSRHYLGRILEDGIEAGEIRPLPLETTASLIQATIDGLMLQWVLDETAIDLGAACEQVVEMIMQHVSPRTGPGGST